MNPHNGQKRVVIEGVEPIVDCGRYAPKRCVGDEIVVEADIFCDGHDELSCDLLWRQEDQTEWQRTPMKLVVNDRWKGSFVAERVGRVYFTIAAWVDHFKTWQHDLAKRLTAGQDVSVQLLIGANFLRNAAKRAEREQDKERLGKAADFLSSEQPVEERIEVALDDDLSACERRWPNERLEVRYQPELPLWVDRERAGFSAWYEMFPRSASSEPGKHGTFQDCIERLPYIAEMGFDIVYLPPIHPIGEKFRKGKNNSLNPTPEDVGSPWAIGSREGGHKSIHPELGTLDDFERFVKAAKDLGLEVALDIALQCAPDHPYVSEHPEWFVQRPDGTIQYAENPPKKYQDIYPFNFECEQWPELWEELYDIFQFWLDRGIRIFRVDNPHTKPFYFWDWVIDRVRENYPETIFLAEAFTRPKVMYRLAGGGFSQSYTYFTWRNTKWELEEYFTHLTQTKVREFFRPNLWPNTPDILNAYLQMDGKAAFIIRLVLAATLSSNYGIYGPAFELQENEPLHMGSEEYLHSEKYQIRDWDLERTDSLRHVIARVNKIRRENEALQQTNNLKFHRVENPELICYSKMTPGSENIILALVNLDAHHRQRGWVNLDLEYLGIDPDRPYQVHDQISQARYLWHGPRNYVELDPDRLPAHIFRLRRRIRTERDFDYFM